MNYFYNKYSNLSLKIDTRSLSNELPYRRISKMTFKELFDLSKRDTQGLYYLKIFPVTDQVAELKSKINLSYIREITKIKKTKKIYTKLFVDPKGGGYSHLHMELAGNLHISIKGKKEWWLYRSKQNSILLNPYEKIPDRLPYFRSRYMHSPLDSYKYINIFPLIPYLSGWKAELSEGDALYVPPFVWHYVRSLSPTISLANWWYNLSLGFKADAFYFLLSLYSLLKIGCGFYNVEHAKEEFDEDKFLNIFDSYHQQKEGV